MTDERLRAAAEEHVNGIITIGNRPPHRPDVLVQLFLAGAKYEQARAEVLLEALEGLAKDIRNGQKQCECAAETAKQAIANYREDISK